ncbi:uncharacterized protein LOC130656062 [Hydractinia symbiolongicarpus]|uniref:uncharacterized protein LOC130656062 n=1 Tax=Hydractinia symbiolongicarpus TaxID=13093 RepID=UPI00254A9784|nr:uncharacterized protein LOC130656062 [Hydractinia symbiolongicarpus]
MAAATSFSKERFMQEVQQYKILYDKFDSEFKNQDMKRNAWEKIGSIFNMNAMEAESKYKTIRSAYGRFLRKRKSTPSGSSRNSISHEYDYLEWLNTYIEHRETSTNFPTATPSSFVQVSPSSCDAAENSSNEQQQQGDDVEQINSIEDSILDQFLHGNSNTQQQKENLCLNQTLAKKNAKQQ